LEVARSAASTLIVLKIVFRLACVSDFLSPSFFRQARFVFAINGGWLSEILVRKLLARMGLAALAQRVGRNNDPAQGHWTQGPGGRRPLSGRRSSWLM